MSNLTTFQFAFKDNSTTKKPPLFLTFFDLKAAYCSIGVLGLVWNLFVLVVLILFGKKQTNLNTGSSKFHICWQACVDATVALLLLTTSLVENESRPIFTRYNFFDEFVCRIWLSKVALWTALTTSTFTVLALNFERYLAIVHPIVHKVKFSRTRKYSAGILGGVLCLSVVYKSSSAIISSGIENDKRCKIFTYWPSREYERFVGVFSVIFEYFIPLGLIIILYFHMALKLHQKVGPETAMGKTSSMAIDRSTGLNGEGKIYNIEPMAKLNSGRTQEMTRARNNILKTSVMLSVAFVVCWSPNQVCYTMYQFGIAILGTKIYHFSVLMVFLNCCFNPAIYCLKYRPFRQSFSSMMTTCRSMFK